MTCIPSIVPAILLALAVATPAAAAECVRPGGPGACFATIQEAVDNATAGETVNIYPGTYRESVAVPFDKPALKLVGRGRRPTAVRIDGSRLSGIGIEIQGAADVEVRNLTVQGATGPAIMGSGDRTLVRRVRVFAAAGPCVMLNGADLRVLGTGARGCGGPGIMLAGTGGLVSGSSVAMAVDGINVSGDDGLVVSSRVRQVMSMGVLVAGANGVARGNRVSGAGLYGIYLSGPPTPLKAVGNTVADVMMMGVYVTSLGGDGGEVSGNVVSGVAQGTGLLVDCASGCGGSAVVGNRVSGSGGSVAFQVVGNEAGLVVRDNLAVGNRTPYAFVLGGTGLKILDNTARSNGVGISGLAAFMIDGDAHEVLRNAAVGNAGSGFRLAGDSAAFAAVAGNAARGNHGSGIIVAGTSVGMPLTGNTATANFRIGFEVQGGATGTTLTSNTALRNKGYDFCDEGAGTIVGAGNTFGTTGCP